ncbi:MAG: hypothetical protein JOZ19_02915 [Rubrobacter sp.]|nr:hypothetical protein [Rubrobacter sp.]
MDPGERTTGSRDEHYNLISVLYHALHGAENCEMYAADAEVAGRDELATFFLEAQAAQIEIADRAKELLGILEEVPPGDAGAPLDISRDIPSMIRLEGEVSPDIKPREAASPGLVMPEEDIIIQDEAPTDVALEHPREAPPPGEERPERRGVAPSAETPREVPPAGEERPERRTP